MSNTDDFLLGLREIALERPLLKFSMVVAYKILYI